jgi:hypothetical protein
MSYKMTGVCLEDLPAFSLRVRSPDTHTLLEGV